MSNRDLTTGLTLFGGLQGLIIAFFLVKSVDITWWESALIYFTCFVIGLPLGGYQSVMAMRYIYRRKRRRNRQGRRCKVRIPNPE